MIETAAAGLPPRSAQAAVGSAAGTARSRRIAIVAPSLSTGFHAPTTMALAHACVLVESGCQVEFFAPQESMLPRMVDWIGTPRRMSLSDAERSRWPLPARGTYRVRLPNLALTMRGRWLWLLAAVQGFAPEAVFFIGAQSPLLWPLQRGWPTLGLSTNAIPPLGPVDLWLAPDAAPREWGRPLATPAQRVHTQRFRVERAADSFDLAPLGLPADAVLWLTSTSRANGELRADWCDAVFQALARHPRDRLGGRHGEDEGVGLRQRIPRQQADAVLPHRLAGVCQRVMHGDLDAEALELAHDLRHARVAQVRAVLLESQPQHHSPSAGDRPARLRHALDGLIGDMLAHAVVDGPAGEDHLRMVAERLRLVGQVIGVDADAVAADQARPERQEVPFGAGCFKDLVGVDAKAVEDQCQNKRKKEIIQYKIDIENAYIGNINKAKDEL